MNLRANPESKFLLKYLLIGIGCLAFAAWSVYDGFIKFPGEIPRSEAWQKLESEMKLNPEATQTDKNNRWKEIAKENNWSPKQLGKDEQLSNLKTKIIYQYIFIGLGLAIGLPCLLWYLKAKSSWIESTEDGLRSSSGQELKISQIQKFDKKKWEKKGIGVIHYLKKDGSVEKFIVDDLKYDRKTTDEIVRWVESNIPDDLIVNGSPEKQVERQTENPYSGEENADSP